MQDEPRKSDEALVSAARRGDRDAFGVLVERYQDLVCAIAYSRIGNLEAASAAASNMQRGVAIIGARMSRSPRR